MTKYRWTCAECLEQGESDDIMMTDARRHTSTHAKGPFDTVPQIAVDVIR